MCVGDVDGQMGDEEIEIFLTPTLPCAPGVLQKLPSTEHQVQLQKTSSKRLLSDFL
ncbi:8677_t:CDS:2 [Ambispora gerdemannii]|uniref:8677_t:CDS:1 n=1 Tax=Ambispora gerdemannii TaxID=144530 RepID=A0A9N9G3Z1_9GLOM|nr:8677_t:CDS:2 [Ambispora gerdemannii]